MGLTFTSGSSSTSFRPADGLTRTQEDAEDAVQEAWVEVMSQPEGAIRRPRTWMRLSVLHAVARNRERNARRLEREIRVSREGLARSTLECILQRNSVRQTRAMLRRIEEPYRTVLELAYVLGYSPSEVAEKLDRNGSTIRSQINAASNVFVRSGIRSLATPTTCRRAHRPAFH